MQNCELLNTPDNPMYQLQCWGWQLFRLLLEKIAALPLVGSGHAIVLLKLMVSSAKDKFRILQIIV